MSDVLKESGKLKKIHRTLKERLDTILWEHKRACEDVRFSTGRWLFDPMDAPKWFKEQFIETVMSGNSNLQREVKELKQEITELKTDMFILKQLLKQICTNSSTGQLTPTPNMYNN